MMEQAQKKSVEDDGYGDMNNQAKINRPIKAIEVRD